MALQQADEPHTFGLAHEHVSDNEEEYSSERLLNMSSLTVFIHYAPAP